MWFFTVSTYIIDIIESRPLQYKSNAEAKFMNVRRTILLRFLGIILRVLRLEVSVYMFTLQTSFKALLLKGGGGGGKKKIYYSLILKKKIKKKNNY